MLDERDEIFMKAALSQAKKAFKMEEVPVGAVAVVHDQIIASAHNLRETQQCPLSHAEVEVLRLCSRQLQTWRLTDVTLYVTLEPCLMCMGALIQARVQRLVFGALDPKGGACGSLYNLADDKRLNHRIEVTSGVMAAESKMLLQDFFKLRRQ